jgi:hypothetical protein
MLQFQDWQLQRSSMSVLGRGRRACGWAPTCVGAFLPTRTSFLRKQESSVWAFLDARCAGMPDGFSPLSRLERGWGVRCSVRFARTSQ